MIALPTFPTRESLEAAIAQIDGEIRSANTRLHQLRARPGAGSHAASPGTGAETLSDEIYGMHAKRHGLHQQLSDLVGMSRRPGGSVGRTPGPKRPVDAAAAVAAEIVRLTLSTLPRADGQHRAPAQSPRS